MFPQRHHMRPDVSITTLTVSTPSRLPFSIFVFFKFPISFSFCDIIVHSHDIRPPAINFKDFGGGQGGGRPGEKGAGGVREAGEEGAGSEIPKVAGSGRKREKLCNIAQYFSIEKMQRGGSQKIQGENRD